MKKIIVFITIICVVFALAACKNSKKNTSSEREEITSSQSSQSENTSSALNSKADEATESKTDIDTQPDGTVVQIQDGSEASEQASGSNNVGSSSQISSSKEDLSLLEIPFLL